MVEFDAEKLKRAIQLVLEGACSKVHVSDYVQVYKVQNVVRVDFKIKS